jgi:hypothetical protein
MDGNISAYITQRHKEYGSYTPAYSTYTTKLPNHMADKRQLVLAYTLVYAIS